MDLDIRLNINRINVNFQDFEKLIKYIFQVYYLKAVAVPTEDEEWEFDLTERWK